MEQAGPEAGSDELARAEKVVGDALDAFEVTVEALREAVAELRARRAAEPEVMRDLKAMNGAYLFAMQMKEKARDAAIRVGGSGARPGVLDLERAREEIALRLACLRTAGEDGAVSGGVE